MVVIKHIPNINSSIVLIIPTSFLPHMVQVKTLSRYLSTRLWSLFNSLITCSSIPSLFIALTSRYLQGEVVLDIRELYLFHCSESLNWIPWLRVVDCFLLVPLPEASISLPFIFDVIDLSLTWFWCGWRLGLDKVSVGRVGLVMGFRFKWGLWVEWWRLVKNFWFLCSDFGVWMVLVDECWFWWLGLNGSLERSLEDERSCGGWMIEEEEKKKKLAYGELPVAHGRANSL